jgi:hypothetical protein
MMYEPEAGAPLGKLKPIDVLEQLTTAGACVR